MLGTRLAKTAAVVALALPAVGHATASAPRVEAAAVHGDNMIWQ